MHVGDEFEYEEPLENAAVELSLEETTNIAHDEGEEQKDDVTALRKQTVDIKADRDKVVGNLKARIAELE